MKKNRTSKIVLIVIAIALSAFTIANLIIFTKIGAVPDTLIVSVFAACLGEFSILGLIRTTKQKYPDTNEVEKEEE